MAKYAAERVNASIVGGGQSSGRGAVAPPKNGKDRWVKASPALLKALRGHLEAIDLDGSLEDWSPEQRQMVFPTSSGNLVRYLFFLEKVWKPLLNQAKLPYRPYHSTRHRSERRRLDWQGPGGIHAAPGTGWELTPWHATQHAVWEALRKSKED